MGESAVTTGTRIEPTNIGWTSLKTSLLQNALERAAEAHAAAVAVATAAYSELSREERSDLAQVFSTSILDEGAKRYVQALTDYGYRASSFHETTLVGLNAASVAVLCTRINEKLPEFSVRLSVYHDALVSVSAARAILQAARVMRYAGAVPHVIGHNGL